MKPKISWSTVLLILIFVAGLSLLLYPTVADWYNASLFSKGIDEYSHKVAITEGSELDALLERADVYNRLHSIKGNSFGNYTPEFLKEYSKQLNLDNNDLAMMGYINIPRLKQNLPIYHTTQEAVLSAGVGHIEGTSLPVGGVGTHCVLSSHRGLPSARLFSDLDQLNVGDQFIMEIMGRTLTYEVDQISIVLPEELGPLKIEGDQDYCTLVTCTPYGVNTHRLLVRGCRVSNSVKNDFRISADAIQIQPLQVAPFVAAPILLILLILLFTAKSDPDDFDDDQDKGGIFRA